MWFIGVEVEQETSAPPLKKNPGSAPVQPCGFDGENFGVLDSWSFMGGGRTWGFD